jgi:alanine-synthesizing transaminase
LQLVAKASRRAHGVEYAIRDINIKAEEVRRSGKKILPLNIGDPVRYDFDTPTHIKKALQKAIESGANYYSPSEGIKELREAVAEKENGVNGAHIAPEEVIITTGISEAILFLMGAIIERGDEVLMPGPCYSPYLTYVKFFDGEAVTYRTVEERGWSPDIQDLESKITERTRLIVIINPSNPCGSLYSQSELRKILELADAHSIPVAADEIYDRIVYGGAFTSVASLAKHVPLIGLNGFSKAYLMTGWRLGYLYLQDPDGRLTDLWDGIQRMSRVRISASTPVQLAGIEALRGPQDHIRDMVAKLKNRRDLSIRRINAIPKLSTSTPAGAFYVFPKVELAGTKWKDDEVFVTDLLEDTGVLVVHGSGFGPTYGKDHFRAVFLPDETMLDQAFNAMEDFMKRNT